MQEVQALLRRSLRRRGKGQVVAEAEAQQVLIKGRSGRELRRRQHHMAKAHGVRDEFKPVNGRGERAVCGTAPVKLEGVAGRVLGEGHSRRLAHLRGRGVAFAGQCPGFAQHFQEMLVVRLAAAFPAGGGEAVRIALLDEIAEGRGVHLQADAAVVRPGGGEPQHFLAEFSPLVGVLHLQAHVAQRRYLHLSVPLLSRCGGSPGRRR